MKNEVISNRIMRRVYVMFVLRKAISPYAVRTYAISISLAGVFSLVSIGNVIANMPALSDISGLTVFMLSALLHTETLVQFLIFGTITVGIWLARDILSGERIAAHHFGRA